MSETPTSWITNLSVLRISDPAVRTAVAQLLDKLEVHEHTKKIEKLRATARTGLVSNETQERNRVLHEVARHLHRITGVWHREMQIHPLGGTNVAITYRARK
jgi:hypothetical protein